MTEAGELWGFDGRGKYAHRGILEAALGVRDSLERLGHLRRLLSVPHGNYLEPVSLLHV